MESEETQDLGSPKILHTLCNAHDGLSLEDELSPFAVMSKRCYSVKLRDLTHNGRTKRVVFQEACASQTEAELVT